MSHTSTGYQTPLQCRGLQPPKSAGAQRTYPNCCSWKSGYGGGGYLQRAPSPSAIPPRLFPRDPAAGNNCKRTLLCSRGLQNEQRQAALAPGSFLPHLSLGLLPHYPPSRTCRVTSGTWEARVRHGHHHLCSTPPLHRVFQQSLFSPSYPILSCFCDAWMSVPFLHRPGCTRGIADEAVAPFPPTHPFYQADTTCALLQSLGSGSLLTLAKMNCPRIRPCCFGRSLQHLKVTFKALLT